MQRTDAVNDPNAFVEDVRTELMRVTQNEDNSQDAFIVHSDLKAIWSSRSRVHTLLKLCCLCPENTLDQVADIIIDHYLKTISILIHIPWMQWPRFTEVFLGNSTTWDEARIIGRSDNNLPYTLQDLKEFLGSYARGFDFHQWLFLPIRIGERRSASLAEYTEDYRLPVLKTEPLGRGASGVVYRETVAPGCLSLGTGSWNAESIEVARKHIETQEDFDSESVVIERLKNNRLRHRHITRCYGVVVRQGRLQSKLDIFYELASSNLSQFLMDWGDHQPAPNVQRHVLTQTFSLIDALVLCHEQFYDPEQGHVILAHNDLKPENILVFRNDTESLVGAWKIADFGLSKIKQVADDSTFLSPDNRMNQDFSLSKAIRPPGGYTAPEIVRQGSLLKDSSSVQCDIWSLGCILAQILVFTVGGSQALKRFNDLRLPGNTFHYRDDRYFEGYPGLEQLRLKNPLFEVLIELCDSASENNWVKQLVNLVFDVLKVDKDPNGDGKILSGARPKASTIRDRFRTIQKSHKSQAENVSSPPNPPDKPLKRKSTSTTDTSSSARQNAETDINFQKERQPSTITSMSISHSVSDSVSSNFDSLPLRIITPPTIHIDDQKTNVNHNPHERDDYGSGSSQGTSPTSRNGHSLSLPCRYLPMRLSHKSPSVKLSCGIMKAVKLAPDARFVVLWSDRQIVVYSLSSAVREQLLDYTLKADSQRKINSITLFGSTLAVTLGAPRSDEIKFFRIKDRTLSQHRRNAYGTLILGETDHFRQVLLGINDAVVLVYSNCLRIGTLRDDLQDSLANLKTVHLKSDTERFFQPSISLDGHRLVVCSRDSKVSQVENWHYVDLSVPREALEDLVLSNAMPPPDLKGSTSPAFMVPLQNSVGTYYSTGTFALFEGIEHGCTLHKNLVCAAATGSGPDYPESQYLVYVSQNQRMVMSKTEIWYVEIQRHGSGGRVKSTSPNRLLALSGKLKQPSLGFNWVREDDAGPRVFCVLLAFPESGSIWCLKLPGVKPRWLN